MARPQALPRFARRVGAARPDAPIRSRGPFRRGIIECWISLRATLEAPRATDWAFHAETRGCARSLIISPPSQTALPETLWPPPRTDTNRPLFRAKFTAAITSAAPAQRAIMAGRRPVTPSLV